MRFLVGFVLFTIFLINSEKSRSAEVVHLNNQTAMEVSPMHTTIIYLR